MWERVPRLTRYRNHGYQQCWKQIMMGKRRHMGSNDLDNHSKLFADLGDKICRKAQQPWTSTKKWTQSPWEGGEIMLHQRNQSPGVQLRSSFFLSMALLHCSRWGVLPRPTSCYGCCHGCCHYGLKLKMVLEIVFEWLPLSPVTVGVTHSRHIS